MGQLLRGSAMMTEAVHRAILAHQEGVKAAAKRYDVSPTTVQKWPGRETVTDAPMGAKEICCTVLTPEGAIVVAFRRHTFALG